MIEAGKKLAADPLTRQQAINMVGPDGPADKLVSPVEDNLDALIDKEVANGEVVSAALRTGISDAWVALVTGLG
ncbi:hypothetical protein AB4144_65000, partial [Rhizobiaceae sp. 2RAB30]